MDNATKAAMLANNIMLCNTRLELDIVCKEIREALKNNKELLEFREWLLDIHWSKNKELSEPIIPFEETLNATGRKWYAKEKLAKAKDV